MNSSTSTPPLPAPPPIIQRLGEELPIFCEECGYSLHGLPQLRCPQCDILHFQCPECGHHQPINTLRPTLKRLLGRLRAVALVAWIGAKLLFFGVVLFAWTMSGARLSVEYDRSDYQNYNASILRSIAQPRANYWAPKYKPMTIDYATLWGLGIAGFLWTCVARVLLLRWRRGWVIGLVLAGLTVGALFLGASIRQTELQDTSRVFYLVPDWFMAMTWTTLIIFVSSICAWGLWMIAVRLLLPRRIGDALLAWQRSLSNKKTSPDAPALFK